MPKISIIVPNYNTEKYLAQCLDALLSQTLRDIEIICVDDGSTDNSFKIIKKYTKKDKRIRYVYQENQGLSGPGYDGHRVRLADQRERFTAHRAGSMIRRNQHGTF